MYQDVSQQLPSIGVSSIGERHNNRFISHRVS